MNTYDIIAYTTIALVALLIIAAPIALLIKLFKWATYTPAIQIKPRNNSGKLPGKLREKLRQKTNNKQDITDQPDLIEQPDRKYRVNTKKIEKYLEQRKMDRQVNAGMHNVTSKFSIAK